MHFSVDKLLRLGNDSVSFALKLAKFNASGEGDPSFGYNLIKMLTTAQILKSWRKCVEVIKIFR